MILRKNMIKNIVNKLEGQISEGLLKTTWDLPLFTKFNGVYIESWLINGFYNIIIETRKSIRKSIDEFSIE
jgi:hypothetical protein